MSIHRNRITLLAPVPRALELISWVTPHGARVLGYVQRGDDKGRLLRLASGAMVLQSPSGAIMALDHRKVQAMIDSKNHG